MVLSSVWALGDADSGSKLLEVLSALGGEVSDVPDGAVALVLSLAGGKVAVWSQNVASWLLAVDAHFLVLGWAGDGALVQVVSHESLWALLSNADGVDSLAVSVLSLASGQSSLDVQLALFDLVLGDGVETGEVLDGSVDRGGLSFAESWELLTVEVSTDGQLSQALGTGVDGLGSDGSSKD